QYQLWGTDPRCLAEGARISEDAGADAVDLNCGCPVPKVVASGSGVALMRNPGLIGQCLAAMRRACRVPLSAKIRLGPNPWIRNGAETARIVEASGADFLTVHGRYGGEAYNVPVCAKGIAEVVAAVKIPVIANGDVSSGETASRLAEATGASGVMVGRACLGDPWVFARIRAELLGEAWRPPSAEERGRALLDHFQGLAEFLGETHATRHIRKLAGFFSRGLTGARAFREAVNHCRTAEAFVALVREHFLPRGGEKA
ncbi:MAG: tRNA-dihydrouridine synthase, partial [Planctomycetota bacterium]